LSVVVVVILLSDKSRDNAVHIFWKQEKQNLANHLITLISF